MSRKVKGILILLAVYLLAFAVAIFSFLMLEKTFNVLINIFICDVIATIIVWIAGIFLKSASVYDPYWSLQTVMIYIPLMIHYDNISFGSILYLIFIMFWAIRLTYNFFVGFNDISYVDWRYQKIKRHTKKAFQIVNLVGIHLVPTLIVYAASVPAFLYVINQNDFTFYNIIGLSIMLFATLIELIADNNMHKFKKTRKDKSEIINVGLWKYSRHPNYLGEIMFWYGVAFVFILNNLSMWYVIIGAILNTLLFIFISIPLAENHMEEYKYGFKEYKKHTRMLIPFKK